jgi:MFS family permease
VSSADEPLPPVAVRPRGAARLMLDPVFGPYVVGKLASTAGVWIHNITAAILAFQLTGSALMVGLVSVAQFAPQLLLAPLSGAMADHGDRRLQAVVGRAVVAAGSGGLALWLALVGVDGLPGAWPVVLAALVVGLGFVVGGPAMNAMVPSMVRPGELPAAIGLNNVPITVARAVGPGLGALVAASAGPAVAFSLSAAGNAIFAVTMMVLPIVGRTAQVPGRDRRMRAGLQHLRRDPTLVTLLLGVAAVAVGADPAITLTPSLSAALGHGTELVGIFASAFGTGAVVVFPLMSLVRKRFGEEVVTTSGLCMLGIGLLLVTIASSPGPAVVAFAVAGAGMMTGLTSLSTQIQLRLPDHVRGRIMAIWAVAFLGTRPLASAVDGALADWVSLDAAFIVIAALVFGSAWLARPARVAPVPG